MVLADTPYFLVTVRSQIALRFFICEILLWLASRGEKCLFHHSSQTFIFLGTSENMHSLGTHAAYYELQIILPFVYGGFVL